jgi:hypothetical protein
LIQSGSGRAAVTALLQKARPQMVRGNDRDKSQNVDYLTSMHRIELRQIVRDAEVAYAISSVVRKHRLTGGDIEKSLLDLRIPRAAKRCPH